MVEDVIRERRSGPVPFIQYNPVSHWLLRGKGVCLVKISIEALRSSTEPLVLVIHSLEQALYQVTVDVDGEEALLIDDDGRIFRRHSLNAARDALQGVPLGQLTLRHSSAYDEMIGQPARQESNALEVSLALASWAPIAAEETR